MASGDAVRVSIDRTSPTDPTGGSGGGGTTSGGGTTGGAPPPSGGDPTLGGGGTISDPGSTTGGGSFSGPQLSEPVSSPASPRDVGGSVPIGGTGRLGGVQTTRRRAPRGGVAGPTSRREAAGGSTDEIDPAPGGTPREKRIARARAEEAGVAIGEAPPLAGEAPEEAADGLSTAEAARERASAPEETPRAAQAGAGRRVGEVVNTAARDLRESVREGRLPETTEGRAGLAGIVLSAVSLLT